MTTATASAFGDELRRWRHARRRSQLELSQEAGVSQRHLSHLETGRSNPSRSMVLRLAEALDVPLRAHNELLATAGFAPAFPERRLDDEHLDAIRRVLRGVLDAHEPAPAYVVDRRWDLVLANQATGRLTSLLPDPQAAAEAAGGNVMRLLLHPDGLRSHVVNVGEVADHLLGRLRRDVAAQGGADDLASLLAELERLGVRGPGVARAGTAGGRGVDPTAHPSDARDLAVPLHLDLGGHRLRLLTMISTIGAAHDVTVEELRLETLLPLDEPTRALLGSLASG